MRITTTLLGIALVFMAVPAPACSPSVDYVNRSFKEKLSGTAFLGKVTALTPEEGLKPGQVTFTVLASHGAPKAGETVTYPHQGYGTCGTLVFAVGQIWVYSGDTPFDASLQPLESDLGADQGKDFAGLIERISSRLDQK